MRDHVHEEFLAKFGLPASPAHRDEIRKLLFEEILLARDNMDGDEMLRLLCVQLFSIGVVDDSLLIWEAKTSNWDAGFIVDVQFLCGAGLRETKDFLETSSEAGAKEALEYIEECEKTGDFADFCRDEWIADYRRYYGVDSKSGK